MSKRYVPVALIAFLLGGAAATSILLPRGDLETASLRGEASNSGVRLGADRGVVHVFRAGEARYLVAEGSLDEPMDVPPGRYDVRVTLSNSADHQSRWIRDVTAAAGRVTTVGASFATGELSIEAKVGAAGVEPHTVVAYVFRPGDHDEIVTSMGTGRTVLIEPGLYDVRAVMTVAARERMVRWHQVEIAEGRHHRLDVSFRRGALRVAALNAGRPLAGETVRLTAYRAEDDQEEPLQSGRASVPMALPVGRYDVKATFSGSSDQPSRWLRDVEIAEDVTLDRAVEFRSGTINVTATLGDGDALSAFDVYVYYYRPGDHAQAVAYTPLGEAATLEAGHYDVRAHFFRSHDQPNVWVRNQELPAGRTVRIRLSFLSGTLLIRARDAQGAEFLGDNVFVDVFAANQRVKPIASARGSETMILGEGTYDVRVVDTRQASRETWLEGLTVVPGRLTEESVTLQD